MSQEFDIPNILNFLGEEHEQYYHAVAPPIIQSANFSYPTVSALREAVNKEFSSPFYTRGYNPTVAILRKKLAALEHAEDALVFGSGTAAIAACLMSILKTGDHAVCVQKPYSWTNALFNKYLNNYGITNTMVDGREVSQIEQAIQPNTRLIYLESPNSITFELQDIEAITKIAKARGITTAVDNSYSSPICQSPIQLGADLVLHSATKYIGGHSDVVAGVVCGSKERIENMFMKEYMSLGAVISPFDAWLMIRSLRTLQIRVEKTARVTQQVVDALEGHPRIEKLYYPFSKNNPQLELAKKQMKSGTGLFTLLLKTDERGMERFGDSLKRFRLATSWGGYESLCFPFCVLSEQARNTGNLPVNLVRFYVGLDEAEQVIEDLVQGLGKI